MENLIQVESLSRRTASVGPEKLLRAICRRVGQLLGDYPTLIEDGDKLMVCISGGKDSYALLDVMIDLQRRAKVNFEILAVNIDQGWPGYDTQVIAKHLSSLGVEFKMIKEDYARIVEAKLRPGQTPCSLCSRFRRGVLYNLAQDFGCSKIALGHHADDLIETLIMNLFFSGRLASMPAILHSDDGRNTVIRPLALVSESLLIDYAAKREFPVVRCGCPSCGLPAQKRQVVKRLLNELEVDSPQLKTHMLAALQHVQPDHLLDRSILRVENPDSSKDFASRTI